MKTQQAFAGLQFFLSTYDLYTVPDKKRIPSKKGLNIFGSPISTEDKKNKFTSEDNIFEGICIWSNFSKVSVCEKRGEKFCHLALSLSPSHFSSLRTFRQVLNLGLLTQSPKIGLGGIFVGQASTVNPTWIHQKRPKSGFSASIILHPKT